MAFLSSVQQDIRHGDLLLWKPRPGHPDEERVALFNGGYCRIGLAARLQMEPGKRAEVCCLEVLPEHGGVIRPLAALADRWPGLCDVRAVEGTYDGLRAVRWFLANQSGWDFEEPHEPPSPDVYRTVFERFLDWWDGPAPPPPPPTPVSVPAVAECLQVAGHAGPDRLLDFASADYPLKFESLA